MTSLPITPTPTADPWRAATVAIGDIRQEIEGVATYDLQFQDEALADGFRFEPGQFNMLYLPGAGEIAISISDDPARRQGCAHTVRVAGSVTGALARMSVGDTLGLRGPFGSAWPMPELVGRDVVLVAGGIGLAPLRPVIYQLLREPDRYGRLHLLNGARSPDTLLYPGEYDEWSRRGLNVLTTVDRSAPHWRGNVGVVTLLLDRVRGVDPENLAVLCCGPEVMMKFTVEAALRLGAPSERIWVSLERNMQCAVGFCGHCQLGPAFVCRDGPVFRHDRIAPFMDVEGL